MAEKYPDRIKVGVDTDWDFYCENTVNNHLIMRALGFEKIDAKNRSYFDNLLIDIYNHQRFDIQILTRCNIECYSRAFESIDADTFIGRLWKSSPTRDQSIPKEIFSSMVRDHFNVLFQKYASANDSIPF